MVIDFLFFFVSEKNGDWFLTVMGNTFWQVSLRLLKLRSSDDDLPEPFENSVQSHKKNGIIGKVKYLTSGAKKTNGKFDEAERPYDDSDGSPVFDSDDSLNESTTSSGSDSISKNSGNIYNAESSRLALPSSETRTRLDTLQRSWSQSSRNRSFKGWTNTSKQETLTTYQGPFTVCNFVLSFCIVPLIYIFVKKKESWYLRH